MSWMEWTPSWGAAVRRSFVEFHYRGRMTTGVQRPGMNLALIAPSPLAGGIRTSDALPLGPAATAMRDVSTHQLSISLLLR